MKKNDVKIGGAYVAKVSDKLTKVRIDRENARGGWDATNLTTGKKVRIKSAQRLRGPAKTGKKAKAGKPTKATQTVEAAGSDGGEQTGVAPRSELTLEETQKLKAARAKKRARKDADAKPKRVSALDAAAQILKTEAKPMRAKDLIEAMAAKGLWSSPNGKTPEATLYAAMLREIRKAVETGTVSRFRKVERGLFAFNAVAAKGG